MIGTIQYSSLHIIIYVYVGIIVCYCLRNESDFKIQSRVLRLNNFTSEYEENLYNFRCDFSTWLSSQSL